MYEQIVGTQCELCPNRVEFNGKLHCTVAVCNRYWTAYNCDAFWYEGQEACCDCPRVSDCPYDSDSYPLAYGR